MSIDRLKKSERERRARQRRELNVQHMRRALTVLERAVLVTHTLGGDDAVWEDFLDTPSLRMRHSLQLMGEIRELIQERAQLRRLLEEHRLATCALAEVIQNEHPTDVWDAKVRRWRELTRQHYKPWTLEACQHVMDAALKDIQVFRWSLDKQTSGLCFLGWREVRRVDTVLGEFQFQFYKTFHGFDLMDSVNMSWDTYTDWETFKEVFVSHRSRWSHEILQQLGPNAIIFRTTQQFTAADVDAHIVDLIFRVKTECGFTQCVRSIVCPELMDVVNEPSDMWVTNFVWSRWEELPHGERGYKLRIGGSIVGTDETFLKQWMVEVFGCILRCERVTTRQHLITSD